MKKNREGWLVGDTHRECTNCGVIFKKTSRMTLCNTCNSSRVKSNTPEWRMHQRAKRRAQSKEIEFSIIPEDIIIPDKCPVLGIKLKGHVGKSGAFKDSPSLDRIDNNKGYTKDNIQVISQCANAMKGAATWDELKAFAKWILNNAPK